ncbi:putative RING zinc finger protein [Plasmodium gaboni]|uniref:Putative RING zinc finger protein n=1 Tax=Plasmodium gaboni TaxID=647221 RepID=A0A151LWH2_9APIC|nr:putative RING zinc finger protein [Plasmodium gaboni]KYO03531.1 putative RING zinc finger protein [Plasmodium gaboni]
MKFGKNIRREMHNHSGMHYINYKVLKKLIKYINNSIIEKELENGKELNKRFEEVLLHDLNIIEETFVKLFKEIMNIKKEIEKNYSTLEIFDNNDNMKISKECISFDTLLNILKEKNVSKEFFNFCVQLSILSNKCKIIRTYVIYNYIGLIKILKKKNKHCGNIYRNIQVTDILSSYTWCLSDELPKLISSVNIISDEFMQKYTNTNVTIEKYICPICLSLIHEPVTLNSCFHSFCWKCLATAIQKYSIDNCPSCRTKIVYDKNSFKIDGILNQFLEKHFLSEHEKEKNRPIKGTHQKGGSGVQKMDMETFKRENIGMENVEVENIERYNIGRENMDRYNIGRENIDWKNINRCNIDKNHLIKKTNKNINICNNYKTSFNYSNNYVLSNKVFENNKTSCVMNYNIKDEENPKVSPSTYDGFILSSSDSSNSNQNNGINFVNMKKGKDIIVPTTKMSNGLTAYEILDDEYMDTIESLNKYVSVLNTNDINSMDDRERECSDYSDEFCNEISKDKINNNESNRMRQENNYNNIINEVLSYTFN